MNYYPIIHCGLTQTRMILCGYVIIAVYWENFKNCQDCRFSTWRQIESTLYVIFYRIRLHGKRLLLNEIITLTPVKLLRCLTWYTYVSEQRRFIRNNVIIARQKKTIFHSAVEYITTSRVCLSHPKFAGIAIVWRTISHTW